MKRLFLTILLVMVPATALATAQIPETLPYKAEKHAIYTTLLEAYFDEAHPRPKAFRPWSSACWRRYLGTWRIDDGFLWLVSLNRKKYEKKDGKLIINHPLRHPEIEDVLCPPLLLTA